MGKVGFAPFTLDKHEYAHIIITIIILIITYSGGRATCCRVCIVSQLELLVRLYGAAAAAAVTVAGDDLPSIYAYSP